MNRTFSSACRTYALTVGAIGMVPLTWAVATLIAHPPHSAWYLIAGIALLSGPLSIRIPSMQATISVSEGFIFTAALLFGPAAATVVAAIDGLAISLWSRHRSGIRMLFGVGEPAISVCAASLLFYQLAGVPPLLHQSMPLGPLALPLLALAATYFALNMVLAGAAVWLDAGGDRVAMLRQHLPHMALDLGVSMSLAAALVQTSGNLTLSMLVILVPMLLSSYVSSHHAAGRLEDSNRHLVELRRLYDSTVETLAMAIDAKDQVTHGHIRRVQLLSTRLGRKLGANAGELQALEAAALLHDLGKLAVPEHILNKPGRLTAVEYEEMKKHADVGASLLSAIDFPFPVVPIVRHHHENWDGSGYPDGLKATDIPLGARILAVIDCYDALTSDRPYRRRMTRDQAIEIIRSRSGHVYDPAVVEAFLQLHASGEMDIDREAEPPAPLRARMAKALDFPAPVRPAVPNRSSHAGTDRVTQFLTTLHQADWPDAGRAVATFVPVAVPDSIAVLFQVDPRADQLIVAAMHRDFDARIPETIAMGAGVSGWVAANRRMMVNADAELDLGDIAGISRPPLRLCVSVPVLDGGELAGVLTVYSPYAFSESNQLLIQSLARELPSALRRRGEPMPPALPVASRRVS